MVVITLFYGYTCNIDSSRRLICNGEYIIFYPASTTNVVYGLPSAQASTAVANGGSYAFCSIAAPPSNVVTCDAFQGRSVFYAVVVDGQTYDQIYYDSPSNPAGGGLLTFKAIYT
jgi:hypothetical protein